MQERYTKQTVVESIDEQAIYMQFRDILDMLTDIQQRLPEVQKEERVYMTRKQVAELFEVSEVTVNSWVEKGILQSYGIGNRVRYVKQEVVNALVPIKRVNRKK